MRFGASLLLLLVLGWSHDCATQEPFALGAPSIAHAAPPARAAVAAHAEPSVTRVERGVVLPPIDPSLARRIRAVVDAHPNRRNDVFAKLGGSSVESRAFLHCFGTDQVLLDQHDELLETIRYFRHGRASGSDPFRRESLAAHVGWSMRHGMAGHPPWILQEIDAISPRWAFLFFGGNDVEGRDPRRYAERLSRVVDGLLSRGVIPILGAVAPRRDRPEMDRWVRAYNDVSRAIADAWQVPYIDFYQAFADLPGLGLAGDGVHPNVFRRGGQTRPCDFSEQAIHHGFNLRNLLSLRMLDELRRAVLSGEAAAPAPEPVRGRGTAEAPLELERAPFAHRIDPQATLPAVLREYACGDAGAFAGEGPEVVARVRFATPQRIRLTALGDGGRRAFVALLGADASPTQCLAGAIGEVEIDVGPGVHHVVVELPSSRDRGPTLLSVDVADGLSAPLTRPHDRTRMEGATATR